MSGKCCERWTGPGVPVDTKCEAPRRSLLRRVMDFARWVVPGAILLLLPKCPLCLMAYIALGTGIGLSLTTASYLQTSLEVICVGSLIYLLFSHLRRFFSSASLRRERLKT